MSTGTMERPLNVIASIGEFELVEYTPQTQFDWCAPATSKAMWLYTNYAANMQEMMASERYTAHQKTDMRLVGQIAMIDRFVEELGVPKDVAWTFFHYAQWEALNPRPDPSVIAAEAAEMEAGEKALTEKLASRDARRLKGQPNA